MDVTKPYEFIGFGAVDGTKPYKFIGIGAMEVNQSFIDGLPDSGCNIIAGTAYFMLRNRASGP